LNSKRTICLHFHIFKNAGTTIEWIFKKNFSKNAVSLDTKDPKGTLSNQFILDYLKQNPTVKSISSHQVRFPTPEANDFYFIPILFLRHPLDRAISIYTFNRRRKDANERPGVKKAKSLNLNDYLDWALKRKKFMVIKNFQVLFLSDKSVESSVETSDFTIASKRLEDCQIVGVVDKFDESLVVAEDFLEKYFNKIDLTYKKQNVSYKRSGDFFHKLQNGNLEIDDNVFDEFSQKNNFDLKLYEKTNEELKKRIKKIDNFEKKLSDFQQRCKNINPSN